MIQQGSRPLGVHLCGSVVLPDNGHASLEESMAVEKVFRGVSSVLNGRICRFPDGEVGSRGNFIAWQVAVFLQCPWVLNDFCCNIMGIHFTEEELAAAEHKEIVLGDCLYDKYAIESYQTFARLKNDGVIPPTARFLVGLPSPMSCIHPLVRYQYQAVLEPLYAEKLIQAVKNIQDHIPSSELSIQWDCPMEMAALEQVPGPANVNPPVGDVTPEGVAVRIKKVAQHVREDVEMGFHICYGDMGHVHFVQPEDTRRMVDLINNIKAAIERPITWFHLPVPKNRVDDAYFAPLERLKIASNTELYLGLVHEFDLEGTRQRIQTAHRYIPSFGIATECGLGRLTSDASQSVMDIAVACSTPRPELSH